MYLRGSRPQEMLSQRDLRMIIRKDLGQSKNSLFYRGYILALKTPHRFFGCLIFDCLQVSCKKAYPTQTAPQ